MTSEAGVSSAFEPELIPDNQLSWMKNGVIRGGKPHTRTPLRFRLTLPRGKLQGVGFFSIQNGMLIVSIDGEIYRIRVGTKTSGFSYEEIPLEWRNSATQDFAWMQETVGYLVIQDGQSNPIIYDGSVARRSDVSEGEVPLGQQMAYGNGRLWVAINEQELVAGDIKTRTPGSELLFTETQYLTGGGAFYFPRAITALGFIPATGAAGYGSLIVYAKDRTETLRADITNRDLWGTFPGFVQPALLNTGAASQFSLTEVNQDLWWRDGQGGIRSLRSAVTDEASGPGNTPQSREVARITDFEDQKRLNAVSAIQFNNRLLMTASPFINDTGATSFKDIISLDFSPISSNRSKTAPSYDGEWEGLQFTRLVAGEFSGKKRGFALTLDPDGYNRLWEFDDGINDDELQICTGTGLVTQESPIPMVLEYPSRDFGSPGARKVLQRCDVYLAGIEGEVSLDVYWRSDNLVKWNQWQEEVTACAVMSDDATTSPHVWKNLAPQGRAQIKTFSIPQTTQPLTGYGNQTGFEHQIRIVVTGKAKVDRVIVHASVTTQEQFALRDNAPFAICAEQDITGNAIDYLMVAGGCSMPVGTALCDLTANLNPIYPGTWTLAEYPQSVDPGDVVMTNTGPDDTLSVEVPQTGNYIFQLHTGTRIIDYPYEFSCNGKYYLDLTDVPADGSGLEGALGINIYAYDGVSALRLIGFIDDDFFATMVDVTSYITNGWLPASESVVFAAFYSSYGVDSEIGMDITLTSSSGATQTTVSGVSGDYSGPFDSGAVSIASVLDDAFVAVPTLPPPGDPGGSIFHAASNPGATIPVIPDYSFGDFTLELWTRVEAGASVHGRIMDRSSGGFNLVHEPGGIFQYQAVMESGVLGGNKGTTATLSLEQWYHLAYVREGSTMNIYVNGALNQTSACDTTTLTFAGSFMYVAGGVAETCSGYNSDLRLWNVARSGEQIAANYQNRLVGNESGLVMYYKFNEPDGVFVDSTGNNVDVTNGANCSYDIEGPPPFTP